MVDSSIKVIFRCDGSPSIGSGHVMRCLSLAGTLKAKNIEVTFWSSEETLDSISALEESGFTIISEEPLETYSWLIVDHYELDFEFETKCRSWARNILVIDDLANRTHDCDILTDPTFGRKPTDYKEYVPEHCALLLGSQYAILKPDFSKKRQTLNRSFQDAKSILISFGGLNPKGASETILGFLNQYTDKILDIDVATAGNIDDLKLLYQESSHNVSIHHKTDDMAELMAKADICIGAGGTTSWERCCLKLPTLAIEVADNQRSILKALDNFGAIQNLGLIEEVTESLFLNAFRELIDNPEKLLVMSEKAGEVCDGLGTSRLYPYFVPKPESKKGASITLRPATIYDSDILLQWQSEPNARQFARNPDIPSLDEHQKWLEETLAKDERSLFIILCDKTPCGMVRLDKKTDTTLEVSILISQDYQAQGIAKAALECAAHHANGKEIHAEVLSENKASQALFKAAGYVQQDETWYILRSV